MHATSLISKGYPCNISHSSMHITSKSLLPSLLSHSRPYTHTPTKNLSNTLQITQEHLFPSIQNLENLEAFKKVLPQNSSSKVRSCIDLWFKFFCYQNPSLIYTKIVILHPRIISKLKIFIKGSQGQKHFIFLPSFLPKTESTPQGEIHTPIFCFYEFLWGGNTSESVDLYVFVCLV